MLQLKNTRKEDYGLERERVIKSLPSFNSCWDMACGPPQTWLKLINAPIKYGTDLRLGTDMWKYDKGKVDLVLCMGVMYYFDWPDVLKLAQKFAKKAILIDTFVADKEIRVSNPQNAFTKLAGDQETVLIPSIRQLPGKRIDKFIEPYDHNVGKRLDIPLKRVMKYVEI